MSTQFDPFRFNQVHGPEPVDGPLQSVCLVDDDSEMSRERPRWFRTLTVAVIAIFLGTTVLTVLRQIIYAHAPSNSASPL